ncbi:hypothetical protein D9M71_616880 [compost metagenome]
MDPRLYLCAARPARHPLAPDPGRDLHPGRCVQKPADSRCASGIRPGHVARCNAKLCANHPRCGPNPGQGGNPAERLPGVFHLCQPRCLRDRRPQYRRWQWRAGNRRHRKRRPGASLHPTLRRPGQLDAPGRLALQHQPGPIQCRRRAGRPHALARLASPGH